LSSVQIDVRYASIIRMKESLYQWNLLCREWMKVKFHLESVRLVIQDDFVHQGQYRKVVLYD